MRITNPGQARAYPQDRNPLTINQLYSATVAPHGVTTRWTYTVPASRKAQMESVLARILRITAAAPVAYADADVAVGNVLSYIAIADLMTNNVGDRISVNLGAAAFLQAGEFVVGRTQDASTGGTISYVASLKATEFDA